MRRPVCTSSAGPTGRVRGFAVARSGRAETILILAHALLAACPGPGGESTTDGASTGDPGSESGATTSGSTSPTETPTGAAETTPAESCPDGELGAGEDCDDGNNINGDGCNNDCRASGIQLAEYRPEVRGWEQVYSLAVDADASIVVGGNIDGQRWVARFGPELAPQWTQTYGDGTPGLVRGVALRDGAIYAAGAQNSDADGHDIWAARLGPDGTLAWEDSFSGGMGDDWLTQAAALEGDLVVTGLALGDQIWTRRYAADGTVQWTAAAPLNAPYNNIYPLGPGLALTAEAVVSGWSVHAMDLTPEFLLAYPFGGGDPSWTAQLSGTAGVIQALAADPGGDLVLAVNADFAELTVRRVTATGEVLWSSSACSGGAARDVVIDGQGDIVVVGDGPGGADRNIRLCKFAADGALRWGRDIDGGSGDDLGYAVAIDPSDRIVMGGAMSGGDGKFDAWLAVFTP